MRCSAEAVQARGLAGLPSLGSTSAALLAEVGIEDAASLRAHGALGAFTALRLRHGKRIAVNWVYALECAVQGIDWRLLPAERKAELRAAARAVILEIDGPR